MQPTDSQPATLPKELIHARLIVQRSDGLAGQRH
jgi:hypothetical protein